MVRQNPRLDARRPFLQHLFKVKRSETVDSVKTENRRTPTVLCSIFRIAVACLLRLVLRGEGFAYPSQMIVLFSLFPLESQVNDNRWRYLSRGSWPYSSCTASPGRTSCCMNSEARCLSALIVALSYPVRSISRRSLSDLNLPGVSPPINRTFSALP